MLELKVKTSRKAGRGKRIGSYLSPQSGGSNKFTGAHHIASDDESRPEVSVLSQSIQGESICLGETYGGEGSRIFKSGQEATRRNLSISV